MKLRLDLRLSQKLIMTPQLQQAIKLLQLSRLELQQSLTQHLMENPLLEDLPTEAEDSEAESLRKRRKMRWRRRTVSHRMRRSPLLKNEILRMRPQRLAGRSTLGAIVDRRIRVSDIFAGRVSIL